MKKIKKQGNKPIIDNKNVSSCKQTPSFSFIYMTTNKKYNFERFKSSKGDKQVLVSNLYKKLEEISAKNGLLGIINLKE